MSDDIKKEIDVEENDTDQTDNSGDNSKEEDEKKFTQEEVNAMMSREKKSGRNSVYKELGLNPKDEKTMAILKHYIEEQKQKKQKAREDSGFDDEITEISHRATVAETQVALFKMGIKSDYIDDAVDLVVAKLSGENEESEPNDILSDVKKRYPIWFSESDDKKENDKDIDKKKAKEDEDMSEEERNKKKEELKNLEDEVAKLKEELGENEDSKEDNKNEEGDNNSNDTEDKKNDVGAKGTGSSIKNNDEEEEDEENLGARLAAKRKKNANKKTYWK